MIVTVASEHLKGNWNLENGVMSRKKTPSILQTINLHNELVSVEKIDEHKKQIKTVVMLRDGNAFLTFTSEPIFTIFKDIVFGRVNELEVNKESDSVQESLVENEKRKLSFIEWFGVILFVPIALLIVLQFFGLVDGPDDRKQASSTATKVTGIPPNVACNWLNDSGLGTNGWKQRYESEYGCTAPYLDIGPEDPTKSSNNIAYYVEGTKGQATQAKLVINMNQKKYTTITRRALSKAAKELSLAATKTELPSEVDKAIISGKSLSQGLYKVERIDWKNGKGYEMKFFIDLKSLTTKEKAKTKVTTTLSTPSFGSYLKKFSPKMACRGAVTIFLDTHQTNVKYINYDGDVTTLGTPLGTFGCSVSDNMIVLSPPNMGWDYNNALAVDSSNSTLYITGVNIKGERESKQFDYGSL